MRRRVTQRERSSRFRVCCARVSNPLFGGAFFLLCFNIIITTLFIDKDKNPLRRQPTFFEGWGGGPKNHRRHDATCRHLHTRSHATKKVHHARINIFFFIIFKQGYSRFVPKLHSFKVGSTDLRFFSPASWIARIAFGAMHPLVLRRICSLARCIVFPFYGKCAFFKISRVSKM